MSTTKAVVYLGALRLEYEIPTDPHDYQTLVKKTWLVQRLNLAASMEGWNPRDCIPFCESGGDDNEFSGLVNMKTGQKINFGKQKDGKGGHWFVRDGDRYKKPYQMLKPESFKQPALEQPTQRQLAEHQDPALQEAPAEFLDDPPKQAGQPKQISFDTEQPANDKQKAALNTLTAKVLGYEEYGYNDQTALFDSARFTHLNGLTEAEAADLIKVLNKKLSKK